LVHRGDSRGESYSFQTGEVMRIHENMASNGMAFSMSLQQMATDLTNLINNIEQGRKNWKVTGLAAEKKAADAEMLMDKAKAKYDSLAVDYDRARTGDKTAGRTFGIKGPKSAAQHEEDLHRKLQAADADYQAKVQAAQSTRQELLSTGRPQAIQALTDLIRECDAALSYQQVKLGKFLLGGRWDKLELTTSHSSIQRKTTSRQWRFGYAHP
jgi:Rho GTPase-activating protein RGD1